MLESLEGKRGEVRVRAAAAGGRGALREADRGQQRHLARQRADHPGQGRRVLHATTAWAARAARCPFQLAGNIKHGGLVEKAFGLTLRELLYDYGGGSASGRPIRAAQVGGPLGAYVPEKDFDTPLDYEAFTQRWRTAGARRHRRLRRHRGHGGDGTLRPRVLRRRVVREVHAVPNRVDARDRGDRQDRGRGRTATRTWRCSRSCATRCSTDRCVASGGLDALPGAERSQALQGGLLQPPRRRRGLTRYCEDFA